VSAPVGRQEPGSLGERGIDEEQLMIILGLILLVLGLVLDVGVLWTIGVVLLVVGAVLFLLGSLNRPVLGRRHYF